MYRNILLDSGFSLAGATAYLYCAGTAKYGGYLATLHLDPDILGRSFHHILYQGFLVSFIPTLTILLLVVGVNFAYAYIILPGWVDWIKKNIPNKRRHIKWRRRLIGNRIRAAIELRAANRFWFWTKPLVFILAFLLLLASFENEGQQQANAWVKQIANEKIPKSAIMRVNVEQNNYSLVKLACGSRICAGLNKENDRVYYYHYDFVSYFLPVSKVSNLDSE